MKETNFIEQNKHKWNDFEKELKTDRKDPEKLSELFVETTDDLSYSRTYYPNRSVRVYLNDIAQQVFHKIYKTKTDKSNNFKAFWTRNIPRAMWDNRKILLWAFIIFISGFAIAVLSSIYNEDFAEIMLGGGYIQTTLNNIEDGDPMAIYGSWKDPTEMFLYIARNNIRVCFIVFVLGIFAGAGTVFMLFRESVRIGAFLYFFWERDLFEDAFYAVMLHGTIELSMIVISGMAGMVMAKGLIFPKSYSRLQSFIMSSRQGIMIMIGVTAFLLIAAFIEGYATRHTDVSNIIRGTVIFGSFAIIISYFIVYPFLLHRAGAFGEKVKDELQPERITSIDFKEIKTSGTIFTEIFYFFKRKFTVHLRTGLLFGTLAAFILYFLLPTQGLYEDFIFDSYYSMRSYIHPFFDVISPWNEVNNFFDLYKEPLLYIAYIVFGSILSLQAYKHVYKTKFGVFNKYKGTDILSVVIGNAVLLVPFVIPFSDADSRGLILTAYILFVMPYFVITIAITALERINYMSALHRTRMLTKKNFGKIIFGSFFMFSVPWILLISCNSMVWQFINEVILTNISSNWEWANYIPMFTYTFYVLLIICISWPLYLYGMGLMHSNLSEINEAHSLRERIQQISFKKRVYGIEKE